MNDFWEQIDEPGLKVVFNEPGATCGGGFPIGFCEKTGTMVRGAVEHYRDVRSKYPEHTQGVQTIEVRALGGLCMSCNKECKVELEIIKGRPTERLRFVFTG